MLFAVDPQSDVPVYRQLMDQVRYAIAGGQLKPGDELPSTRALSSELGVNPMTISKAYSYLERDGILERRPGRPLVVRALDEGQLEIQQVDLLRESLAPIVVIVRQLGLDKAEALHVFGVMLDEMLTDGGSEEGLQ
jgi:GntR family transcriptional regulator